MKPIDQAQVEIDKRGLLDRGAVLHLPTGGGKTFLGLEAARRCVARGQKAVYLCPLRAIARELMERWRGALEGLQVGVYTGEAGADALTDNPSPGEADVLIATPEKFDFYLRQWRSNLDWLAQVGLVTVDELHTVADGRRGATLEGAVSRFRAINPFAAILGLSATVGNAEQLAEWLGCSWYRSTSRPVPLVWKLRPYKQAQARTDIVVQEVRETMAGGGQVIVFVQARSRTDTVVRALAEHGIEAMRHHAGLSSAEREAAERRFREGDVKCIVATPTLSMGINLPSRKVVLYDMQRWEGAGWEDLTTNEVWQLAGRAGRFGLDTRGEAVLLAPVWKLKTARRYTEGRFEGIESVMAEDSAAFCEQIVVAFGSGLALREEQALRVMERTLLAAQSTPAELARRCRHAIQAMEQAGMLTRNSEGYIRPTQIGRIAVRFQLTPATVAAWQKIEDRLPEATLTDLLALACANSDFAGRVRADSSELKHLQAAMQADGMALASASAEVLDEVVAVRGKTFVSAVKTALALRQWTRFGDIGEAAAAGGVGEHELEEARKEAVRMLQAMAALLDTLGSRLDRPAGARPLLGARAGALAAMVAAGLDDAQATLAMVDGIGPVLSRRLASAGIGDIATLAGMEIKDVATVDGVSRRRAEKWIARAGELVHNGVASRYTAICDGERSPGELPNGVEYSRWERAMKLDVAPAGSGWIVSGAGVAHRVSVTGAGYVCECADAMRGRVCKHQIAVRHGMGDPAIPRFDKGFPCKDVSLQLKSEWQSDRCQQDA